MAQTEKAWHPNFIRYMEKVASHPNYKGLAIERKKDGSLKWLATAKSSVGKRRIAWAEAKAQELGLPLGSGMFAKVMYHVHPTKLKVCQICGKTMSIQYIYPNVTFANTLIGQFGIPIDAYDSMYDVWDTIIRKGFTAADIIALLNKKFGTAFTTRDTKSTVLTQCEELCRLSGKKHLGPGAMSNFPDRFDGFHSYNRCHRGTEDKGRSKENLKSYTRDRRAYEYWSDGNIQAANQFMGSAYFAGMSADHVGPISLGFVHDPRYLRRMHGNENSTKRDRLTESIIDDVLAIYQQTGVYPMSWYSAKIWEYIVTHYKITGEKIAGDYRLLLKRNMSNYMYVLKSILCSGEVGEKFLVNALIAPKRKDFLYSYEFDPSGNITAQKDRKFTMRSSEEFARFARIAVQAVYDYSEKDNRNVSHSLTEREERDLAALVTLVQSGNDSAALTRLRSLVEAIQVRLLSAE